MAELGRIPGNHRALHPGSCCVGHEGEPRNDSGLQTLDCCNYVHTSIHAHIQYVLYSWGSAIDILQSQRPLTNTTKSLKPKTYNLKLILTQTRERVRKRTIYTINLVNS